MTEGPLHERGEKALARAYRAGVRGAGVLLLSVFATYSGGCWLTARKLAALPEMRKTNGAEYNLVYLNQVGRRLHAEGFIERKRIEPGEKPPEARHTSAHGTSYNRPLFGKSGLGRDPVSRHELSLRSACVSEPVTTTVTPKPGRPKHSAPVPPPVALPPHDPLAVELARFEALAMARQQREQDADDVAMMASVVTARRVPKPPS